MALTTGITIETDSTAAKSIATRIGISKLTKHIQFRFLYVQDLVKNGILRIAKVHTSVNPADAMTKHLTQHVLHKQRISDYGVKMALISALRKQM